MTATTAIGSSRRRKWCVGGLCLSGLLAFLAAAGPSFAQRGEAAAGYFLVPGDAKAGLKAFFDKGCMRCHAVLGEGGKSAPDLARAPGAYLSGAELVTAMWNHAPQMWMRMREEKVAPPAFAEAEMTNLFAFLYSVRSLDEPGDPQRGRLLFSEKRCAECHGMEGKGSKRAPDLRQWGSFRNPVSWIQTMWNHAPAMQAHMEARNLPWPEFQGHDVADLIAYVRTQAPNPPRQVSLKPTDPVAGKKLFREKGCASCHGLQSVGARLAPDLRERSLPRTFGQFAAQMWNHSPAMLASMRAQGIPRPSFSNKEMADLTAYLFVERYFDRYGDATQGRRTFEVKGCVLCHTGGENAVGPSLARWRGRVSPSGLATAFWNHGPMMLSRMKEKQIPWPLFRQGEMVDLMEYLNRGVTRGATAGNRHGP